MIQSSGEPTSNCNSLASPYPSINGTHFNLLCGVDYPDSDLMSVWVYQFVDCLHACVSFNVKHHELGYNETCTGVSYALDTPYGDLAFDHQAGNCFLKAAFPLQASYDGHVDSAFYTDLGIP